MTMTSQSPSSFSMPSSPEGGFDLPSPTLTPGPSSPLMLSSMQGTLIPEAAANVSPLTHSVSVTEGTAVTSSTSSCAYSSQVWMRDFNHHNTMTPPPPLQVSRSQGLQTAFTTCFRLGPPPRSTIFSLAAHRPPVPQFYHPLRDYRQQVMAEMNYVGMQGRREGFPPPGVIPGMHQVRVQGQSTIQYPPMFPPSLPMPQHGYCNLSPSPLYEARMPAYRHTGPQFSNFQLRPQVPPLYRPQSVPVHSPQFFPQPISQFCQQGTSSQTPTSPQLCPPLHPLTPATSLSSQQGQETSPRGHPETWHPQSLNRAQLQPLTPAPQYRPQTSMSQLHPLSPVPQLQPLTPTSQLHPASKVRSQITSQTASPQVSFINRPQDAPPPPQIAALRPQTAPPKVVAPQRPEPPQPVPHCQPSQQNFVDLTSDVYATQQRTITCVRNYPAVPSSGLSSNPHTSIQGSQQQIAQTIPHQQVESSEACSEPSTPQLCISVPIQTSPRGTHHVIHRPKPIRGTASGIPSFSPGLRPIVPLSPFSPGLRSFVVPISTVPGVTASLQDLPGAVSTKPTPACVTPSSPSPDAREVATITSSAGSSSQPKKAAQAGNKKAGKQKPRPKKPPAEKKPKKPRTRRAKVPTKEPTKAAEGSSSMPTVAIATKNSEVEIGEQVVEVVASDLAEMQIYVDFVKRFKSHHLKLGYSLEDIVQQVKIRYGKSIDLQCIKDFEDLLLQKESYVPLLEILDTWVKDTAKASGSNDQEMVMLPANSICPHRSWKQKRKQKTSVDTNVTLRLEEAFARKKSPTQSELTKLANGLGVEKDYVKNWFYNRRKKEKCMGKRPAGKEEDASVKSKPAENMETEAIGVKIPSIMYDITVEIPSIHPRDKTAVPCAEYTLQN